MNELDICLFIPEAKSAACQPQALARSLRKVCGISAIHPSGHDRVLHIRYVADEIHPRTILNMAERMGCRATLIGL